MENNNNNNNKVAEVVAIIDHQNGVVTNFLELDLSKFNRNDCKCDICKKTIYRSKTFIIRNEKNELLQAGKNCLQNIQGIDWNFDGVVENNLIDYIFKSSLKFLDTKNFIWNLINLNNLFGYKIDILAYLHKDNDATKKDKYYSYLKENNLIDYKNRDYSEAEKIIAYYRNLEEITNNNFLENLRNLMLNDVIDIKYINIVKYAVKNYNDKMDFLNRCNNQVKSSLTEYTTTKIVKMELVKESYYSYGWNSSTDTKIFSIIDNQNNRFQWETSRIININDYIDKNVKFIYKIKYNGEKAFFESKLYGIVQKIKNVKII